MWLLTSATLGRYLYSHLALLHIYNSLSTKLGTCILSYDVHCCSYHACSISLSMKFQCGSLSHYFCLTCLDESYITCICMYIHLSDDVSVSLFSAKNNTSTCWSREPGSKICVPGNLSICVPGNLSIGLMQNQIVLIYRFRSLEIAPGMPNIDKMRYLNPKYSVRAPHM